MWNILNVKGPSEGIHLNNLDKFPIGNTEDERLNYLLRMSTSLKLMDASKRGQRINCLTNDTSNAWHMTLLSLIDIVKSLLGLGVKYVCMGKLQSDRLEGEFGVIRQLSGGNYWISVEQVVSSLALRRLKMYASLEIDEVESVAENTQCCAGSFDDRDEDLDSLDSCFENSSKLNEVERSALYYICGYITFKEKLPPTVPSNDNDIDLTDNSNEFTCLVSRGRLKHPDCKLYDYSLYCFSFFKDKTKKCCSKPFLEAFKYIYTTIGYDFKNIDRINRRFINCFFKGLIKKESEDIQNNKSLEASRKKRKLRDI